MILFTTLFSDAINCLRWSLNGDMFANASYDTNVRVWDFKTEKLL